MLPPEIAKQIRLLEIRTNRVVDEITAARTGAYSKGAASNSDEVREYTPETMSATSTERIGPHGVALRQEIYGRARVDCALLVDVSASGAFGSAEKTSGGRRRSSPRCSLSAPATTETKSGC